ncbi:MAG: type I methionyl aminopeptidase [Patescibacteria group bacterium]
MLIKSQEEIKLIKKGGKLIGEILDKLSKMCKPGVSTFEIDQAAEKMIFEVGGRPSFKGYKIRHEDIPFPNAICASRNHELVHGIAKKDAILKNGDIFSIDIGMEWPYKKGQKSQGFYTDTALTVPIGKIPDKTRKLLNVTQESLEVAIGAIRPGNSVADIGKAVEEYVKSQGKYGIVRDLVGHGVGHAVHEEPRIPNFYDKALEFFVLKPGMVIAIEPMISVGGWKIKTADDGWTVEMSDGSLCAHFEHTIVVTKTGNLVATRRPCEI